MPNEKMDELHQELIRELRRLRLVHPQALGGVVNGGSVKALRPHRTNQYFYHLDLKGAYDQVKLSELARLLVWGEPEWGTEEEVTDFLARFCFNDRGHLATGGPASVDLFNIALSPLDTAFSRFASDHGLTYTRYLDDLIFSACTPPELFPRPPLRSPIRQEMRKIVESFGFRINHRSSHIYDLAKGPAMILGIGIELGGRLFVPRPYLRHVRGLLHLASRDPDPTKYAASLAGKMGVVLALTSRYTSNQTEQDLLYRYRQFRTRLRQYKRAYKRSRK
jgi:hypothetical protein